MFNNSLEIFHIKREQKIASRLLPIDHMHDDLFLVEYPKSGITYLCHLFACLEFNSSNMDINFFNLHSFIPDIHEGKSISTHTARNLNRRILKSHASYNKKYRYVVHLARDPLDTMVSYKNYWLSHWNKDIPFSKLIRSWRGIPRWKRHTNAWINSEVNQRYIPVSYQSLLDRPATVLKYIYDCYGVQISDSDIQRAILNSSLENMQSSEQFWNYGHRHKFQGAKFVGSKKFKKDDICDEDIKYIRHQTSDIYSLFISMCNKALDNN